MSNTKKILGFLHSIAPKTATNAEIGSRTGIRPHQQVFQITRRLFDEGHIRGRLFGKEWEFWTDADTSVERARCEQISVSSMASAFEKGVRALLEERFGTSLGEGVYPGIHKR